MYLQLKFSGKKARTQVAEAELPASLVPPAAPLAPAATQPLLTRKENAVLPASGPRIKTYVAESVPQAMTLARREMGEDAILIQTKRRENADAAKRFEVTFGVVPGASTHPQRPAQADKLPTSTTNPETDVALQLGSLRRELTALQTMLRRSSFGKLPPPDNDAASAAYYALVHNDIDADLASELVRAIEPGDASPADAVLARLATQIRIDPSVAEQGKVLVLMGPAASGKTTALIKLAVEYGLKLGKSIEILSLSKGKATMDRTLESMAAILGVPCEALPNIEALESALARPRPEGTLMLVDTNGYGVGAAEEDIKLSSVLASGESVDIHLVLPASWHPVSIRQTVDRFEIYQPARLIFTMLDQAAVYGPLIQEAWRTRKPLSFVSSREGGGTALRPADLGWIVARMFETARDAAGQPA
jgi:flagellar biosynthesis protein FlhF